MFKTASGTSAVSLHSFEHFMASSVINKSTDAPKTVRDLFFTTNPKRQAGRALNFERKCGVKQTKKAPFNYSTSVTNKNKELVRKNVTN